MAECSLPDCTRSPKARKLCNAHYQRWRRTGDPTLVRQVQHHGLTADERFWRWVERGEGCWLWLASTDTKGYGLFGAEGKLSKAHRYAYELLVGPIPEGLVLDHLCRVRHCVNPDHLEPVTTYENILRGEGACASRMRGKVSRS